MVTRFFTVLSIAAFQLLTVGYCLAEPPHVSYIFPAGGQRGTDVSFKVGGHYLHEGCPFEMAGPGVLAASRIERTETVWFEGPLIPQPASQQKEDYPKDYLGHVTIASDATLGSRRWRVSTSQGVTPQLKFVVGDLPEVVEEEIDGESVSVSVQLPVTINGRIFPREDVDIWEFEAQAGERIACEVNAARIGSPLDSRIEVRSPRGDVLIENVDALGVDSFLQFVAPDTGHYECRIHDIEFKGLQDYVYRLTIRKGPHIDSVFPLGGRRGEQVTLHFAGTDLPLRETSILIPSNADDQFHWSLPDGRFNSMTLVAGNAPERLEAEPNNTVEAASADVGFSKEGLTLNGRIDQPGDVDLYKFSAEAGRTLLLEVHAERLGTPLDSVLSVLSSDGQQLMANDDLAGGIQDSRIVWKVPDGEFFFVQIQDQFDDRGDARFAYRVSITEVSAADFALRLPAETANVTQGGETKIKVTLDRSYGFKGEVEVSVEGLPKGVTCETVKIAKNRQDVQLILKADESAIPQVAELRVVGKTIDIEPELKREAMFEGAANEKPVAGLTLGVAIKTPFKVFSPFETRYASRGTTYTRHFQIDRGGYEGPIEIEAADRQVRHLQGVIGEKLIVPPGESEFDYTVSLPPWMEIGRTSRFCLMGSAFVEDKSGTKHRVSYSSQAQDDQVIVLVDPVRISVQLPATTFVMRCGDSIEIPVTVQRGTGLKGAVEINVSAPSHLQGWSATPFVIARDQDSGLLQLHLDEQATSQFNAPLVVTAKMKDGEGNPVWTESRIYVRIRDAGSPKTASR
ncbi:MAG: hypothetical protein O3B13_05520 [Planctomycetota bacterium]|nr:hypothetical protein [Planctomycetota bacterium]